ncbi:MAG: MFS transporter [Rhodobacterales bacterium]|nr:MAG: MFS transporter [Rhodobacterales bacterium]
MDRADIVHNNFIRRVSAGDFPTPTSTLSMQQAGLDSAALIQLFHAQVMCRQLDRTSRKMQAKGEGYYTIGSSGHEGNAAIAAALRVTDPAFLHYRDAAFQIQRAQQLPGQTPIWDMLLSFATSTEDPISGGRHKVLGSKPLNIPPQTSTIASHLPKAIGAAYSIGLNRRIRPEHQVWPKDAIVLCSFGDASLNHSTAQGAFNTAGWTAYQGVPLPLIFLCEDNGIGISTKTPADWVHQSMAQRPGIKYFQCSGLDLFDAFATAQEAAQWVRKRRKPAFLHMQTVRLYGHAGADAQQAYLSKSEIEADEANDPLLHSARRMIEAGVADAEGILQIYNRVEAQTTHTADQVAKRPRLQTAEQVMHSIIPARRDCQPSNFPPPANRQQVFGKSDMAAMDKPQHMAKLINFALTDLMLEHREIIIAGEDVGPKGGVYGVTQKLHARFGAHRTINTLLDEQSILGLAIGLAHNGLLPMPEIQFLAYLHNAEDQIRGEAATLSFFSNRQYSNPMVLRIAGLGYQRGFGGHFHNDNSIAVLRDIPGVIIACPSNGHDAALMLREAVRLAREEQRIVVFLEPIALYMTRDLHTEKDAGWSFDYPQPARSSPIRLGEIGSYGNGKDLAIVSYANGYYLSRQAEKILREQHDIHSTLIDLRWLAPLPEAALLKALKGYRTILIVDECRQTGSQSEALMALFAEKLPAGTRLSRLCAEDCFIATGPAYGATLPSRDSIVAAALVAVGKD